jgi:hypothetical protein
MMPCFHQLFDRRKARALSIEDESLAFLFPPFFVSAADSVLTELLAATRSWRVPFQFLSLPLELMLFVRFNKPKSLTGCLEGIVVFSAGDAVGKLIGDGSTGGEKNGADDIGVAPSLLFS